MNPTADSLRLRTNRTVREAVAPAVGWVCLAAAALATVLFPVTLGTVVLAFFAAVGIAFDRRFGPMPAALLVILALPYDRVANTFLPRIADIPIRPQDAALLAGVLLSLPLIRRLPAPRPIAVAVAALLGVGVVAFVLGVVLDNSTRDILRDARWWGLYGAGLLAMATLVPRPALLRALFLGTTIFAILVIVTAVLPAFADALKARAVEFDRGLLRMQFGNTTFLLVALAAATAWATSRATPRRLAWLILIITALVLSLTRTVIVVAIVVMALTVAATLLAERGRPRRLRRAVAPVAAAGLSFVLAVGLATFATAVTGFTVEFDRLFSQTPSTAGPRPAEDPLERLLLQGQSSGIDSLGGGRFVTYRRAIEVIAQNPLLGSGLGALVVAEYSFGGESFDTPGKLPNVDNAWLTIGMKGGIVAIIGLAIVLGLGLLGAARGRRRHRAWLLPAWLGVLALTMAQSFATTGYGPFVLGLLAVLPTLPYARTRASSARDQRYRG